MSETNSFNEKCYQLLNRVPQGKVTTYGEIARALNTKAWRAVGTAMAKNKNLITIPCHRVVRSDGSIGQYASGADNKARLLIEEGVDVVNGKVNNMQQFIYKFNI